jgi:hypothetical protein
MKKSLRTLICLGMTAIGTSVNGQTTYEDGPDGVRYQVTRQVVQRSIPTTEYQAREQKVYHPQVTTEYQTYAQTYMTPVTQYQWEPHLRNWWNPFGGAYWTHEYRPVTRWAMTPGTVQVPVARTNWVEETRTTQVPVTTYRTAQDETVSRVAIGPAAGSSVTTTTVANRIQVGGQQMQSDPPKAQSAWSTSGGDGYRR